MMATSIRLWKDRVFQSVCCRTSTFVGVAGPADCARGLSAVVVWCDVAGPVMTAAVLLTAAVLSALVSL